MEFDSVSAPESQATAPGNGNAVSDVVSVAVAAAPGAAAASKPTSQVTPSKFQEFYPLRRGYRRVFCIRCDYVLDLGLKLHLDVCCTSRNAPGIRYRHF